ncbi:IclR family transcriptional regulator [Yinghuangia sp. YIM S09857]|uniref:IclR family transcriptional regulator n=1 Tax=Yinghuangia sp. YIM S09857 TaxID=3436929 RepID=UPI003F53B172
MTGEPGAPPHADPRGKGGQTVAVVERAADVLLHFCETRSADLGITEIADALGLSKAAVHRLLGSLRSRGLVEMNPGTHRYALGPAAARLGLAYLGRLDIRAAAVPELRDLSGTTGETATLSVRAGDSRIYVDQVTPDREVIMSVTLGIPYPLDVGASSRALLAFLPEAQDARLLARLLRSSHAAAASVPRRAEPENRDAPPGVPAPASGAMSGAALRRLTGELADIRARGWSRSAGERQPGAGSVAAPVFDHHDRPVAVVSVCGPRERFGAAADHCLDRLVDATDRLSRRLGAPSAVVAVRPDRRDTGLPPHRAPGRVHSAPMY